MVSTKWEALGQGGAKSQERPREATGCAKELQSVSWGCKGCKQARKILSAQTNTVAFLNDKLILVHLRIKQVIIDLSK